MGEPDAALLQQMVGGKLPQVLVTRTDEIDMYAGGHAIDEDVGSVAILQEMRQAAAPVALRGCHDETIDASRKQQLDFAAFRGGVLSRIRQHNLVSQRSQLFG